MHFEFSESTHKWCGQCGANIRKHASWCRFCHKHIASKFLRHERNVDPSMLIDGVACWLPQFNDLVFRCGLGLQERFQQAELATAQTFTESDSAYLAQRIARRSASICNELPSEPQIAGLLQDTLLNLHECGEDLERLCEDPRLVLIELTPSSIINEADLRWMEQSAGNPCKYCHEFILSTGERCRFCESNGHEPPAQLNMRRTFSPQLDIELLTSVVLWEEARLRVDLQPSLPAAVLDSYGITPENIESEIVHQSRNPENFPMSLWRTKMLQLHLKTERPFEETEMEDLLNLGSACSWQDKNVEAEIVYKHGLRRLKIHHHLLLAKQRMIDGLAQVYFSRKDYENHHRLKEEANQLLLSMLPEHMRQLSVESEKDKQSLLMRISQQVEIDPRKGIEQAEARLKKLQEQQGQMIEQAPSPEIRIFLESQLSRLNRVAGPGMEVARLHMDAQDAKNAGDLDTAGNLLEAALSKLGNERNDVGTRSGLLSLLADIQLSQGKSAIADNTHSQAICIAEELAELNDGSELIPLGLVCLHYALFLMELERYAEAEKYLVRALEMDKRFQEKFARNFRGEALNDSETEAKIKTELAKLLRHTNRVAQAEEAEEQVVNIKERIAEREHRLANDRRNFLEMVSDDKPPENH